MRIATAESKVRNLLSGDIKAILVGAGSGSAAAMTAAATATPVRVTGIVTESAGDAALAWPTASFAICPDEAGLARALRSWRPGSSDQAILIPWIIRILPGADLLKASGIDLEVRLR
jgi:pimeloyl-ACP methyl ester carboxylesterase